MYTPFTFDAIDEEMRLKGINIWRTIPGPRVGDFVEMADGRFARISVLYADRFQVADPRFGASFHFLWWYCSYSGGHGASYPLAALALTNATREGDVWVFHHDIAGAHRGVGCTIRCRVYRLTPMHEGAPMLTDHAIEILKRTRDGEDLDPAHLKLVEMAVNGQLNDKGKGAFAELLANVRAGYVKPWFHGVEHMTRDHEGYVLWKVHAVEHFSRAYAHSDEAKTYVQELARRCLLLEEKGITPSTTEIVWRWPAKGASAHNGLP